MAKQIRLSVFILFILHFSGYSQKETRINLGESPWKFTKIIPSTENLALRSEFYYSGEKIAILNDKELERQWNPSEKDKALIITMDSVYELQKAELLFKGGKIQQADLVLEGSSDNKHWETISDKADGIKCQINKQGDISSINNTVGYTESISHTTANIPINKKYRYLKLYLKNCFAANQEKVIPYISEIIISPVTHRLSDSDLTDTSFDDSKWETVGIPHCYNDQDTHLNATGGERCWRGDAWYRKKVFFGNKDKNKEIYLEFEGVNIGTTVYINGHAIEGNTKVKQPGSVTHIGSSVPFVVNLTRYIQWDKENQIAIKVSNRRNSFFTWPEFGGNEGFGQAMGGIVNPVYLYKKNKVHIPFNSYSPLNKWGTYFGTVSATPEKATIRFQTNVENLSVSGQTVTLKTKFKDKKNRTVLSFSQQQKINSGETGLFDHTDSIHNPTLWYPVGGSGSPYLYTISNEVYVGNKLVDSKEEQFGIRVITWDNDYCYVNGEKCILRGFGNRNLYPGLGAAVPAELQWKEISYIAECGGNTLRIGHQPCPTETFKACDAYGVLLIVNSGDNEWSLKNEPNLTYKREYDRDVIIAFRNHPSVAVWESNNGLAFDGEKYLPSYTLEEVRKWDYICPRIVLNRDGYPPMWDKKDPIVVGYTNRYSKEEGSPSLNTEVYGANWSGLPSWCIARFDYENEKKFSQYYVENYLHDISNRACGWIDWMLAETYGEGYTIYLNGMKNQKSLGSCAMDGNRFPKLKYRIYQKALWVPYTKHPGVALQSHWNWSGKQDVDAWSNCPYVELFINKKSYGIVVPDKETRRCTWKDIAWEPGTVEAIGLNDQKKAICSEQIESSEEPYAIQVTIEKNICKPNGEKFELQANASDAFIVTAKVVDKQGRWCPRADNLLHFSIEGEGVYKGSYNFYVTEGKGLEYHAPGDTELQAEGGLMRVAGRTTFNAGKIKVRVSSDGLVAGEASVKSEKADNR